MRRSIVVGGAAALVLAGLVGALSYLGRIVPSGSGYQAKVLCSGVFVSHRDPDSVRGEEFNGLHPLMGLVRATVDEARQEVRASFLGLAGQRAVFRPGLGCTLTPPGETLVPLPVPSRAAVSIRLPESPRSSRLDAVLEHALSETGPNGPRQARALVVLRDGRIVAERYAPGFSAETPLPGWSMTKTVTAALVGILVGRGRLSLDQPAPVAAWRAPGDPRGAITVEQLLHMTSGLAFDENAGDPLSDLVVMLYRRGDTAAFAADKPLRHPPGRAWSYSSGTANILSGIVRATFGGDDAAYVRFPSQALFDPIGMTSAVFEPDAAGTLVGSSYLYATTRDWARFGQLLLQDGVWEGRRILPEGWVATMATPAPAASRGGYGAQIWLNRGRADDPADVRWPNLPRDVMVAAGFGGQVLAVVPGRNMVVVRLGETRGWSNTRDTGRLVAEILAAAEP